MNDKNLEQAIEQHFIDYPNTTDEDIMQMIHSARKDAILQSIPQYEPLSVDSRDELDTEFEEEDRSVQYQTHQDESTVDDFEDFDDEFE